MGFFGIDGLFGSRMLKDLRYGRGACSLLLLLSATAPGRSIIRRNSQQILVYSRAVSYLFIATRVAFFGIVGLTPIAAFAQYPPAIRMSAVVYGGHSLRGDG